MVPFVDSALEIDFMVLLDLLVGERNFVTQNSKDVHAFFVFVLGASLSQPSNIL